MNYTTDSIKALHDAIIRKLGFENFNDGTYNLDTLEAVSFEKGYQVSFYVEGMNYSESKYAFIVSLFLENSMDGQTYIGYFDGCPEISFRIADKKTAVRLAKQFNQICIWSWKKSECIETGGDGRAHV